MSRPKSGHPCDVRWLWVPDDRCRSIDPGATRMTEKGLSERSVRETRSALGGRPFRLLLVSLVVSSCGDWLYNVALLALV